MRPIHVFLILVFAGLIALAVWFWINQDRAPAEIDIAMDRPAPVAEIKEDPAPVIEAPTVAEPTPPVPEVELDPTFGLNDDDCRWLTRHIPDADVAYKPGVDVHGKPVVPADLNGTYDLELPRSIVAGVSRRLLRHPNLRQETPLAEIEIDLETGSILINGKGLLNDDQKRLIAYCKDRP